MNRKKNKKLIIIIISIVLLIFILILGGVYAYVATDVFKSNKELFFKYLTQIGDNKKGFIETSLKQYSEKKKNNPYSDQGSVSVNITAQNGQSQFENTNKTNLTFDGQVNNPSNQLQQNISLNYSDSVKFPIILRKVGDVIGIQTDKVGSKFVALDLKSDNSSIEGIDEIKKVQDLTSLPFNEEELKNTINNYLNVLNEQLKDNNFGKIEEANNRGYKLSLTGEELKNTVVKLLETLKNDQTALEKINEYLKKQKNSLKITVSDIDNQIENINNNKELDGKNIEIAVYQSKKRTNHITIKVDDTQIGIEKKLTGNDLQYYLEVQGNINGETQKVSLIAKFQGLQAMQSITENYELVLQAQGTNYQYNYNNNVEFIEATNIEEFNDDNSLNLSNLDKEQRNNFISSIIQRIQKVNKKQMQQIGVEENENPLQYIFPQTGVYSEVMNTMNTSSMDEEEVATFNKKFEVYESTNLKGVTVKGLLTTIGLNNENQEYGDRKIKEIHFDGEEYEATEQNITILKGNVELEIEYRVEFEKDEDTRCYL